MDTMRPARRFWTGIARAFAGALVFALPLFMTMEMWWLGFTMDRFRLALLVVAMLPLLTGLSYYIGFEQTHGWLDAGRDGLIAYGIGYLASFAVLVLLGVIERGMSADEVVGKVALSAVPASIGAVLARSELGGETEKRDEKQRQERTGYFGELFIVAVGALFLAFNVAPTEEMILISYMIGPWLAIAIALISVAVIHGFVYALDFAGGSQRHEEMPRWRAFLLMPVTSYAVCLIISLYILWSFGRTDGNDAGQVLQATVVLGFPAAIGGAAARLIL